MDTKLTQVLKTQQMEMYIWIGFMGAEGGQQNEIAKEQNIIKLKEKQKNDDGLL